MKSSFAAKVYEMIMSTSLVRRSIARLSYVQSYLLKYMFQCRVILIRGWVQLPGPRENFHGFACQIKLPLPCLVLSTTQALLSYVVK
jgi:hypothetical protein